VRSKAVKIDRLKHEGEGTCASSHQRSGGCGLGDPDLRLMRSLRFTSYFLILRTSPMDSPQPDTAPWSVSGAGSVLIAL
jgi:hypothetical protein